MDELIHTRTIKMDAFDVGEGKIRVDGQLQDVRHREGVQHLGLALPPGLLHDMRLSITVNIRTMEIEEAAASMPKGAEPGCPAITSNYEKAVGLKIGPGFKKEAMRRLGGAAGCSHLTTLLSEMGTTVIQATAAFPTRKPERQLVRLAEANASGDLKRVNIAANGCHMWAEDGPLTIEVREMLAGERIWGVAGKVESRKPAG